MNPPKYRKAEDCYNCIHCSVCRYHDVIDDMLQLWEDRDFGMVQIQLLVKCPFREEDDTRNEAAES